MLLSNLGEAHGSAVANDGRPIDPQWASSETSSVKLGPPHSSLHPFNDQAPFKLSDGPHNRYDRPTERPTRVDILPEANEFDAEVIQLIYDLQEMPRAASNAV